MTRRDLLACVARDLPPVSHGENNNANDDDDDDDDKGARGRRMGASVRTRRVSNKQETSTGAWDSPSAFHPVADRRVTRMRHALITEPEPSP
jgi:hypothetical protein